MERKKHLVPAARALTALSALLLAMAAAWDTAGLVRGAASPDVSYVMVGVAVALACSGVLARVLSRRPGRVRNSVELLVIGLVLTAWWLRGDPGVPTDPPLIGVELFGALVLGGSALFARPRAARPSADGVTLGTGS